MSKQNNTIDTDTSLCSCGSSKLAAKCCVPFLNGEAIPATAEALMRSRYVAYSKARIDYIEQTMIGPASERFDSSRAKEWAIENQWLNLNILSSQTKGEIAYVEFIARFRSQGHTQHQHEKSEFHLCNDRWYYYDGVILPP
ncbi:MAG: YchJ family metal-binding protein [Gammaproteobacteria bacterium]